MRNGNPKKCLIVGMISIILLSIFPVVSSMPVNNSEYVVAVQSIQSQNMLSPIPIITKPEVGCWYLNDDLLFSGMPTTRIIGYITITVKVIDPTGNGVDRVEFKIDDVLKAVDNTPTIDDDGYYWFEWLCNDELPHGEHVIKVVAFDSLSNSQSRSITVIKGLFNSLEYVYASEMLKATSMGLTATKMSGVSL